VSFWTGGLLTLIFLALTSISIYAFCKKFINRKVGFLSAALFSFSPLIFLNSIRAMTDIPYMLFLVLTIYEFLKALESGEKKHFIFSAILFSIGFLIKWNVALIIPMIFLYALINYRSRLKKLIFSFLLIAVILSPYLLLAIKAGFITVPFKSSLGFITLPFKSSLTGSDIATQDPQFTSTGGWIYYFEVLWNQYLTIPIFILAIISFVLYCIRREKLWKLFLLWFLTYYLVFTIIPNKEDRYILPAVIPMIIPLSHFVMSFKKSLSILFSVILVLILIISSYMVLSQSNQYKTNFDMIVKTLNNGNIALATEPSWFYSSEFMFRLAALDENITKIVLRPCSFSSISINNMIDNGVNYFIVAEPTEDMFTENVNLVKSSSDLYLFEKIETKNSTISIYAAKGYNDKNFDKICNYVCVLQDWICTKYIKPSEALI
jgi:4-amino-4-deoxy-L-arabinose transferase-like glycosyltransferase